jgi:hypothetical protein
MGSPLLELIPNKIIFSFFAKSQAKNWFRRSDFWLNKKSGQQVKNPCLTALYEQYVK